ncbi:MAG: trigger factor [Candidatus Levybacteria bacterium]|nr:trigger factor [Candidatus Levybacteria bacterium]
MISALQKLEDGTIKLDITISSATVKKTREEVINDSVKNADVSGFRKGKAPKNLVEEKIDEEKVKEEVLKKLLPQSYTEAVKENQIKPIINPKIHIHPDSIKDNEDWKFTAFTSEVPQVDLDSYKENIQKITAKTKIVVPGKEQQSPSFEEIMKTLLESVKVTIPKILVEGEVERLLSQSLDEIKKLGLTLDQYLLSTGRTPETLRGEYEKKAENDIKLEFTLQKIAEAENITVDEKEVEEAIIKAKDDKERKNLENNRYLLTSILRQQKTLDFLKNL